MASAVSTDICRCSDRNLPESVLAPRLRIMFLHHQHHPMAKGPPWHGTTPRPPSHANASQAPTYQLPSLSFGSPFRVLLILQLISCGTRHQKIIEVYLHFLTAVNCDGSAQDQYMGSHSGIPPFATKFTIKQRTNIRCRDCSFSPT